MSERTVQRVRVPARPALRIGPASAVFRPAMLIVHLALLALLSILVCVGISRGDFPIALGDIIRVLTGGGARADRFIVLEVRLPRAAVAVLVGAALGVAGTLTQSTLRNPLAGPDILGITAGAGFGTVALITLGGGLGGAGLGHALGLSGAALLGGLGTAAAIYLLSWRRGVDGFRLVLVGIGMNALLLAGINWLLTYADIRDVGVAVLWLNGSVADADWAAVGPLAGGFAVAVAVAAWSSPTVAVLRLGDDKAASLGVRLRLRTGIVLLAAVLLASFATAAAGPIAFVALAAPQIARRLYRCAVEPITGSALIGAILVVQGDIVGRTLLPVALPVGIITSAAGGIYLSLVLLLRTRRRAG